MGIKMSQENPTVLCDRHVKYEEAEVHRLFL